MRTIFVLIIGVMVSACATITRGTTTQVQIHSDPPEAQARTSMGFTCVTPCTLQTSRKDEFTVIVTKPGYHTVEIPVRTQVAGAGAAGFAGNIILGGVVGNGGRRCDRSNLRAFSQPVSVTLTPRKKGEPDSVIKITPEPPAPKPEEVNPRT